VGSGGSALREKGGGFGDRGGGEYGGGQEGGEAFAAGPGPQWTENSGGSRVLADLSLCPQWTTPRGLLRRFFFKRKLFSFKKKKTPKSLFEL
jgi:hypothetical protein